MVVWLGLGLRCVLIVWGFVLDLLLVFILLCIVCLLLFCLFGWFVVCCVFVCLLRVLRMFIVGLLVNSFKLTWLFCYNACFCYICCCLLWFADCIVAFVLFGFIVLLLLYWFVWLVIAYWVTLCWCLNVCLCFLCNFAVALGLLFAIVILVIVLAFVCLC